MHYHVSQIVQRIGIPGLRLEQESSAMYETGQLAWEAGIQMCCYIRSTTSNGSRQGHQLQDSESKPVGRLSQEGLHLDGAHILELGSGLGA